MAVDKHKRDRLGIEFNSIAMTQHAMFTIIRYILLTASRDWLFIGLFIAIAMAYGLSVFTGSTALTEQSHMALALFGGSSRAVLIVGLVVFVCFHVRRAFEQREIESLLSKPLSRTHIVIGYWIGLSLLSIIMVIPVVAMMLLALANVNLTGLFFWASSMACEITLVVAFALLSSLILSSAVTSVLATFGFYILSRLMGFFVAAMDNPGNMLGNGKLGSIMMQGLEIISTVIPRLDLYAKSEWLVYGTASATDIWIYPVQTLVFVCLLLAMAVFDFKRKEF